MDRNVSVSRIQVAGITIVSEEWRFRMEVMMVVVVVLGSEGWGVKMKVFNGIKRRVIIRSTGSSFWRGPEGGPGFATDEKTMDIYSTAYTGHLYGKGYYPRKLLLCSRRTGYTSRGRRGEPPVWLIGVPVDLLDGSWWTDSVRPMADGKKIFTTPVLEPSGWFIRINTNMRVYLIQDDDR